MSVIIVCQYKTLCHYRGESNRFVKIFKEKMKTLNYYKFRKMAEPIIAANWASYQVFTVKDGKTEGKVQESTD